MKALGYQGSEFKIFLRVFFLYINRRLHQAWVWFEKQKDALVELLVAKRGTYQRPFLHTSLLLLVGVAIVGAPIIATTYPSVAADQLSQYTPPSAVLSSFDGQDITTQKSERVRDSVYMHTVVEGDTLSSLAQKFDVSVDTIKWANADLKGERLTVGQQLSIPPVTGIVVKVKKGETIYSIAKKYKTDAQKILNYPFNDFSDLDTFALVAGQNLVVPDGVIPESQPIYSPRTIAQVGTISGNGQFIWPSQGLITQFPVSYHMALDIANSSLPPIIAADGGTVVLAEFSKYGYGRHVIIDHQNGFMTLYGHMSEIYVSPGQGVSKGSVIGKMGSTGRSTGAHLHFEIRKGGTLLNPLSFLK